MDISTTDLADDLLSRVENIAKEFDNNANTSLSEKQQTAQLHHLLRPA